MILELLAKVHFVSFLMDGLTDSGNKKQELVFVVYCEVDDSTKEVHSQTYLAILSLRLMQLNLYSLCFTGIQ